MKSFRVYCGAGIQSGKQASFTNSDVVLRSVPDEAVRSLMRRAWNACRKAQKTAVPDASFNNFYQWQLQEQRPHPARRFGKKLICCPWLESDASVPRLAMHVVANLRDGVGLPPTTHTVPCDVIKISNVAIVFEAESRLNLPPFWFQYCNHVVHCSHCFRLQGKTTAKRAASCHEGDQPNVAQRPFFPRVHWQGLLLFIRLPFVLLPSVTFLFHLQCRKVPREKRRNDIISYHWRTHLLQTSFRNSISRNWRVTNPLLL